MKHLKRFIFGLAATAFIGLVLAAMSYIFPPFPYVLLGLISVIVFSFLMYLFGQVILDD